MTTRAIKGSAELRKTFAQLKDVTRGDIIKSAVFAGALLVSNRAQELVAYVTGTLRRSIHIEIRVEGTVVIAEIGTDVAYAARVEFGFSGADALGREYTQSAQPYLRPAHDERVEAAFAEIGEAIAAAVLKATS